MKTKKSKKNNKGGTLVEALVSIAIISFVIVSILSGFSQQQADTSRIGDKNMAVMLAEQRMEELLKFPSSRMDIGAFVDYVVLTAKGPVVYGENDAVPSQLRQFRRTTDIQKTDALAQLATITVTVEYGARKGSGGEMFYPYSVRLVTRRSSK